MQTFHLFVVLFAVSMLIRHGRRAALFLAPSLVRAGADREAPPATPAVARAGDELERLGFVRLGSRREAGAMGGLVDPSNPNSLTALNQTDPNLKPTITNEVLLSVEHEVLPAFVLSLTGTYRHFNGYTGGTQQYAPVTPDFSSVLTPADYTCTPAGPYPLPDGTPATFNRCNPNPGVAAEGRLLRNRPGYSQRYWGIDVSGTKRYWTGGWPGSTSPGRA